MSLSTLLFRARREGEIGGALAVEDGRSFLIVVVGDAPIRGLSQAMIEFVADTLGKSRQDRNLAIAGMVKNRATDIFRRRVAGDLPQESGLVPAMPFIVSLPGEAGLVILWRRPTCRNTVLRMKALVGPPRDVVEDLIVNRVYPWIQRTNCFMTERFAVPIDRSIYGGCYPDCVANFEISNVGMDLYRASAFHDLVPGQRYSLSVGDTTCKGPFRFIVVLNGCTGCDGLVEHQDAITECEKNTAGLEADVAEGTRGAKEAYILQQRQHDVLQKKADAYFQIHVPHADMVQMEGVMVVAKQSKARADMGHTPLVALRTLFGLTDNVIDNDACAVIASFLCRRRAFTPNVPETPLRVWQRCVGACAYPLSAFIIENVRMTEVVANMRWLRHSQKQSAVVVRNRTSNVWSRWTFPELVNVKDHIVSESRKDNRDVTIVLQLSK